MQLLRRETLRSYMRPLSPIRLGAEQPSTAVVETTDDVFQRRVPYPQRVLSLKRPGQLAQDAHEYQSFKAAAAQLRKSRRVVMGDLHGSWEKLLETLAMAGMVTMTPDQARGFYRISQKFQQLVREDVRFEKPESLAKARALFDSYEHLVGKVRWSGGGRQMVLTGDTTLDRGQSDLFTLTLMSRLFQDAQRQGCHEPLKIVFSNHDHWALSLYNKYYLGHRSTHEGFKDPARLDTMLAGWYRNYKLVAQDPALMDRMKRLYETHFQRQVLMAYDPQTRTLVTHGSVDRQLYTQMMKALNLTHEAERAEVRGGNPWALQQVLHKANLKTTAQFITPVLNPKKPFEEAQALLETPALEAFVEARKEPARTGGFPLPTSLLAFQVHGHTCIHDELPPTPGEILLNKGNFHRMKFLTAMEDVSLKERPNPLMQSTPKPVRINLNNYARFDDVFYAPVEDQRHVVNKLLVLA